MGFQRYFTINPLSAETYIRGASRSRDIHPQRWKIRDALQQIDPDNRAVRRRHAIQSRILNVNKLNHLWHIDSNHKLMITKLLTAMSSFCYFLSLAGNANKESWVTSRLSPSIEKCRPELKHLGTEKKLT